MAKLLFKPSMMKLRKQKPNCIILHHTADFYDKSEIIIDNPKFQSRSLYNNAHEKAEPDINFNYYVEQVKDDYFAFIRRPISFLCDYDDIPKHLNDRAIHIALVGDMSMKVPTKREYEILAYKLISPICKIYVIPQTRIYLHNEVSEKEDLVCPGWFLDKDIVISMMKKYIVR